MFSIYYYPSNNLLSCEESFVSLSDEDVKKVARLAALEIKEADIPNVREKLNSLIEYVDTLSEIPTRGVAPTFHVHGTSNIFRDDVIRPSLSEVDLEMNAPDFSHGFFKVPQIIKTTK